MSNCDYCGSPAHWSIGRFEDMDRIEVGHTTIRTLSCGRHLHRALVDLDWLLDVVEVYDLTAPVERS